MSSGGGVGESGAAARGLRAAGVRVFLAAVLLHGLAYHLLLPPWMGEDEHWHLEYAHHVAEGYRPWGGRSVTIVNIVEAPFSQLQVQRRFANMPLVAVQEAQVALLRALEEGNFWERVDWAPRCQAPKSLDQVRPYITQTAQPPLYYLLAGGWLALFGEQTVESRLWLARGLSLVCYVLTVVLALAFARIAFRDERLAFAAALVVAWLPMHARQAGVVNNDVLAKLLGALGLWLAGTHVTRRAPSFEVLGLVAVVGAGILTKSTAAGTAGVALLAVALGPLMRERRGALLSALAVVGVLVAGLVMLRLQHSPAVPDSLGAFLDGLATTFGRGTLAEIARTSVGAFNWYSRGLPGWVYVGFWGAAAGVALGALAAFVRRDATLFARAPIALAIGAVVVQLGLIGLRGVAAGRYFAPAAPAIGALVALGFLGPLPSRWRSAGLALLAGALLAFDGLFLFGGLLPNQYLVWGN